MYAKVSSRYHFNKNSSDKGAIFLRLRVNGKIYQLFPGITLGQNQWNQEKQKAVKHQEAYLINDTLDRYKVVCLDSEKRLREEQGECTSKQLKSEVDTYWLNKETSTGRGTPIRFWEFLDWFIEEGKRTGKDERHTISEYRRLKKILKNMRPAIEWGDLDESFYYEFCLYCEDVGGYSLASIGKHVTALKAVINKAKEENINSALKVSTKGWKAYNAIKKTPTLSLEELDQLFQLDLSKNPSLDEVRNLFYFACWTGLRPGDFTQLSDANIESNYIIVRPRKTNKNAQLKRDLYIPISKPIKKLMAKTGKIPRTISSQHMNRLLPALGKMIGMTDPITITKSKLDGSIHESQEPRFQHLKCRCARKTFATNADVMGLSGTEARAITGHATEKAYNHYVMTDNKQTADAVRKKIDSMFDE